MSLTGVGESVPLITSLRDFFFSSPNSSPHFEKWRIWLGEFIQRRITDLNNMWILPHIAPFKLFSYSSLRHSAHLSGENIDLFLALAWVKIRLFRLKLALNPICLSWFSGTQPSNPIWSHITLACKCNVVGLKAASALCSTHPYTLPSRRLWPGAWTEQMRNEDED